MSEERVPYTTPDEVAVRLMRMEAYIKQLENTNDGLAMIIGRHAKTINRLEQENKRLEQDLRRLRYLDAMPVDALDRIMYDVSGDLLEEWTQVREWLDSRDGDA